MSIFTLVPFLKVEEVTFINAVAGLYWRKGVGGKRPLSRGMLFHSYPISPEKVMILNLWLEA